VPDEVSLAFTISGCPLRCEGCHSHDTWDASQGDELTMARFSGYLKLYEDMITCVVFFGGEWNAVELIKLLEYAKSAGLKTCLYSGMSKIPQRITNNLTYLKTGCWQPQLGGLDSNKTNQRFIQVATNQLLNYKFIGAQQHASL
jgi:anaerobic ribonucleoside-triphosphate reductase activating protein